MKRAFAFKCVVFGFAAVLSVSTTYGQSNGNRVTLERTPQQGIQPQAVLDRDGVLHLIFFFGKPGEGDLFYVRRYLTRGVGNDAGFSKLLRVNSQPGSAVAAGTVRGGQLAIGDKGKVHVVWFGSNKAEPKNPIRGAPLLYTRLNDAGTAFEPQRNLMRRTFGLDGGPTLAVDAEGNVFVAWHGKAEGDADGEEGRRVWVARSTDGGKTFSREAPSWQQATGCCACCSRP